MIYVADVNAGSATQQYNLFYARTDNAYVAIDLRVGTIPVNISPPSRRASRSHGCSNVSKVSASIAIFIEDAASAIG